MSLVDEMKQRVKAAMKAKKTVEKEILRLALSELQKDDITEDAKIHAVLKKLIKSNSETIAAIEDAEEKAKLEEEIAVLQSFLPETPSPEQIVEHLAPVAEQVKAAKNDGQATGVAMKHLKGAGVAAEGKDVAAAVKLLRGAS